MPIIKVSFDDIARTVMAHKRHNYQLRFNTKENPAADIQYLNHVIRIMYDEGKRVFMHIRPDDAQSLGMTFEFQYRTTQKDVCRWLHEYANRYNLSAEVETSSYLVDMSRHTNDPVYLNATLFELILYIQRARSYYISRAIIQGSPADWYPEVKRDYDDTPGSVFEKAGIAKNKHNFEEMLRFPVTDEMWRCQAEELGQFKTAFWR